MPGKRLKYDYAVIRIVPRVEREEFCNAGVIVFCKEAGYLNVKLTEDMSKAKALSADADVDMIKTHLDLFLKVCVGGNEAGVIGVMSQSERFGWLVAPKSTGIQVSPVHSGLCQDPNDILHQLFKKLVN